ncbi:phosphatase PAP2 family protein [Hymenobacter cellulosilyticus]|uniref:Phosphatase PAP2 family protein n=1 Tax=Hymenobacter cellulosilyticus TaxID=2932248 RepID=A0A8T9Q899_9BACT|nr:phosphatase PAP2 family protein [Hymenobacter cellulosilyticus]UOQ72298.1 phosphatase PAP2 family protein [Hymenobacter cellulosilyticus]
MGFRYVLLLVGSLISLRSVAQVPAPSLTPDSSATIVAPAPLPVRPLAPASPWRRLAQPATLRVAVPLSLIGVAWLSNKDNVLRRAKREIQEETLEAFPTFDTRLDDYTRHVPIAAAYALQLAGVKGERGVVPFTLIYLLAHQVNMGVTSNLKRLCREQRPDIPTDYSSFPSSHTSEAFMTATLLHEQYGKTNPWISVGGYAVATATGTMRVLHNRHWVTDVVAGAGIGFLSAEAVWHLYPALTRLLPAKLAQKCLLVPTYVPGGGMGLSVAIKH